MVLQILSNITFLSGATVTTSLKKLGLYPSPNTLTYTV
jgi:hypothetical protein